MKKSNKRLDFLPNRQNKYSIRKFTVGTASILVGAILLFGAQNDAQAEEAPADSASSTTETKALDVSPVEASTAEVAPTAPTETTEATSTEATTEPTTTEPTTTETSTTETTTEEATAEKATSETKPADSTETPSSTEEATTEPASAEPTTTESSTTEPATVEPATTEQPSKEATTSNEVTSEAPSTESAPVDSTQEATSAPSTPATETPAVDAPAITSEATAVDYVANTTSLSSTEAETLVSDLNLDYNNLTPEELQAALIDGLVAQQNATATEATPLDRRQTSALSDIDSVTYGTTAFRAAVTPETALADNATYQPYAKQDPTNYRYGTLGDATEAIANTAELPADTQYTFKDNNVFQRVGNQLATVVATYADGTTDEVLAPIYVSYAYEKDGVSYSGVPYSAENNFTRTEEDVHIVPNLEDLSSTESRADNTIDFDLSAVFNLVRVNSGMETYIELDERIAQYVTSIDGNIASTAAGASPDRPFVWERVVNAKGELTNTWKMRSFNALAYSDGETSVFLGDQPSVSQVSSSTINLSDTVENIFANDPLLQNGDLAFRTYTLTEEGQIVNTTDRTNYFQVAQDEKDTLTEATALTERNWFTGSGAITRYEAQAGNNGGIVFDQYFTKSSNGTLNGYGAQPNRDWTYNFEIDPRLLPYIDDVEIHYLDENGVDWTASTELSDRFANESSLTKNQGWNNFEYRYNNGTSIESAYTTGTTWNDTRDGAPDKDAYTVPDVELQPGQGYMSLDAVMINVDSRQLNFRPGLIQPAKVRVVATLKDGVSINDVLGQNRDENFGFTGYLVNGKNEIIPNTAGTGYYQAMDVDGDGIVDEIDPSIETPDAPVVNNPQPNDGTVTGSGEPGGTVVVTFPNGDVVTGTVGEDGTWTVNVPPTETLEEGEVVTAVITDDNGNTSTPGNGTVTDTIAPDAPVVNNPQPNDGTVTGSGEPGETVVVTFPNGDVVTGTVGEDGTWTVNVPPTETLEEGEVVTAVITDDNGNTSTPGNGTVTDTIAPDAPVVNNPQPNDGTVTGSGEPGGTVVVTFPNGDVVTGTVGEDGTWTVDVPPTETLEEGEIVTAVVTDDNGNTSTPGNGTVTDTIAPDAPVVNNPQPNDGTVTGTGEPGGTVTVTFPNGEVVTGTVDEDGTWTVDVPPTVTLTEGDIITATVEDDNGNVSTPGNGTVTDTIAPEAPVVNDPQPNDGTVTGTGEPGGTVTVTFPNGEVVTGTVEEDGTWTVDVPPTVTLTEGDVITATVEDDNGNVSTPGNGTVTDTIAPDAPVVNNPQPNDGTVTGTGEPGGTVTVTFPNGEVVTGTVEEDGTWTVDVPPTVTLTEGDVITATVEDDNGNVSTPGNGTVTDTIAPDAPVVNNPQPNDGTVTGTGEPGGTVTVTFPNGEVVTGTVDEDGTWTVDVPLTVTLTEGDVITATVEDDNGNVSTPGNGTVTDTIAPDAPVVNNPQPNDGTVTGTGEPGGTVTVTFPNGEVVTGTVEEDGTWTVDVPPTVTLTEGDVITATVEDDNGNVSTPGNGTVTDTIAPDAPVVNNPQPNDGTVTGTGEPGGTVTVTFPNGEVVTGTVDEDGTWTVDVPPTVTLTEGDVITATVEDDNGNVSTPGNGTVTDTIAPDAPVVNNPQPNDGTVTGTGEPGGTVTVTFPNGEVVTGTVEEDGTWTVDVPPTVTLTEGDVITATVEDDNGNVSTPGNGTVTDTIAPEPPVVDPIKPGDTVVTGEGEPGGTVTVTFPNGDVVTGTVGEDGTWAVDVPPTVTIKDGDTIVVTQTDKGGNESDSTTVVVTGDKDDSTTPPVDNSGNNDGNNDCPVVKPIQNNDTSVTGQTEPGAPVKVEFPGDTTVTTEADDEGQFTVSVPQHVALNDGDTVKVTGSEDKPATAKVGELPETGSTTNPTLFGGLIAALGSLFLFGRRRKEKEEQ
ncbi:hypothetical protein BU673_07370 [Staphylococcus chromogenes]|uniref:Ig-like domain-containing protein n=5 Tax=Staphylococcus chromogenes TaxID=46126 RepID=UPI000D1A7D20|nr:Ig-like domain-containing protein [Staphylococcus chromogenes]PTG62290.1 hypothetical protein BU673_07370 [Staphylococcus chromogenes]